MTKFLKLKVKWRVELGARVSKIELAFKKGDSLNPKHANVIASKRKKIFSKEI